LPFNKLFQEAREKIDNKTNIKFNKIKNQLGLSEEGLENVREAIHKDVTSKDTSKLNKMLIEKRPEMARAAIKNILTQKSEEMALELLEEKGIDPKATNLFAKFKPFIYNLRNNTTNVGIIVRYINDKLFKKFGPVKERELKTLSSSLEHIENIIEELRRMI